MINYQLKRVAISAVTALAFSTMLVSSAIAATGSDIPVFNRTLSYGSKGPDVKLLQIFLNKHGYTVTTSGDGSLGHETTYFGKATLKALKAFQASYSAELVTNVGLSAPSGILGPITQAKIANIAASPAVLGNAQNQTPLLDKQVQMPAPQGINNPNAPVITNNTPAVIAANNNFVNFSVITDEPAYCKYDSSPGKSYEQQANGFQTVGGLTHTHQIQVSNGQNYTFYVRCASTEGNHPTDTTDTVITFNVASTPQYSNNLNVTVLNQAGTVTSSDGQITCGQGGTACSASYANPTTVTLSEQPYSWTYHYVFDYWQGGPCDGSTLPTCTINVNGSVGTQAWFILARALGNHAVAAGVETSFSAAGSVASPRANVSYNWDFGDGSTASGVSVKHTYQTSLAKTFTATLTVKDNTTSVASTDSLNVNVTPAAAPGPAPAGPPVITNTTAAVVPWNNGIANLSFDTDEAAFCTYDNKTGNPFVPLSQGFQTDGGTSHLYQLHVDNGSSYTYYVRCESAQGNQMDSTYTPISFSVAAAPANNNNLTVTVINQAGTVTSSDGQINCGYNASKCTATYSTPTSVMLTETPSTFFDYALDHWQGGGCDGSTSPTCTVNVNGYISVSPSYKLASIPFTANAGADQTVTAGNSITLTGSASFIPSGHTVTYSWDFGDGSTASGQTVAHMYPSGSSVLTFQATLTIVDTTAGKMAIDSATITVNPAPNHL